MKPPLHQIWKPGKVILWAAALAIVWVLAAVAHAQDAQFRFDANGNLAAQTTESSTLPQILTQPQSEVVSPGALASFIVVAANTHNLTYQWRFNGTAINGATGDALLLQNVSAFDEGQYSVVLANSSGSITSAPAALMLDGDGDGLPDSWEQTYFGSLVQKPTGDFDGDGVSNLDEYLEGTNPADSASVLFRLTVISDGGQVTVNPGRFAFTNGEVVTLAATEIGPITFHGWRGATNSTQNPISLTMDGNKTVYAYLGIYDITWTNNASGDWNVASNWSPDFVPGTNDNVFLTRGVTVTLNSNTACGNLTLTSGTLTGSGTLTVHRDSWWSGGGMSGSGRTVIPVGATLALNPAGSVSMTTRVLENGGTVFWTGAGSVFLSSAVITNRAGALFQAGNASSLSFNGGTSRFDNAGTFRKTAGGTTTVNSSMTFNNYNTVEVQAGTLLLEGGGVNQGTMDFPAGTTLNLGGGTFTESGGASIAGAGSFIMSGATANLAGLVNLSGNHTFSSGTANLTGNYYCTNNVLTIAGGTANFNGTGLVQPTTVTLSSGTLTGNQLVTVLGTMTWPGGGMSGSGRTVIPVGATLALNPAGSVSMTTRVLENGGTVFWTGAGSVFLSSAVITNRAGALFQAGNASSLSFNGGTSRFDNAGTFRKTAGGTTTVNSSMTFNNYNVVEVQAGTLLLEGGGVNQGTMDFPAGTTLNLGGGTFTESGGASIAGAGSFIMSGATANLAGLVNLSGNHTFSSGTANLTGNYYCTNNVLTIAGGTANFNGTGLVQPTTVTLSSGTLTGNQLVTVLGTMTWPGGGMSGSGRTVIPVGATLALNPAGSVSMTTRVLENGGTVFWTGAGSVFLSSAVITNRAGALFQAGNASSLSFNGGTSRFDNAGTFRKTAGGTTTVNSSMTFNNYNTVEVQAGTLLLEGGGVNQGTMDFPAGTTLNLGGGTFTESGGASIAGAGSFIMSGATANLAGLVNLSGNHTFSSGTANLTGNYYCTNNVLTIAGGTANFNGTGLVQPTTVTLSSGTLTGNQLVTVLGTMTWPGGGMSGSGRTVIPVGATLALNPAGSVSMTTRVLENGGTVFWTGAGSVFLSSAVITNRAGALFQAGNASSLSFNGGTSRFDNAGTFRKTAGGTTTVNSSMTFNNYNTVEVQAGTLLLEGGGVNQGTMDFPAGTTLNLGGGTFTESGGASIAGAGSFIMSGATANLAGLVNLSGNHTFSSGTANLTGNYYCTNNVLTIAGGTANFNGTGLVQPTTVTLSSGTLTGNQLVTVLGTMTWPGGGMSGSGRTVIPVGATLALNPAGSVSMTTRVLENGGTVFWTGAGSVFLSSAVITNRAGALFQAGNASSLSFNGGTSRFDNAGTFRKTAGGTTTVNSSMTFNNYNVVEIRAGILAASGGYTSTSNSLLSFVIGGTTAGTGYGRLQVAGTVTLNGALSVNLIDGFIPATNDTFTVLAAGTRNGTFANFFYPSNAVAMQLSNTANSVIVRVTDVFSVPQPATLPAGLISWWRAEGNALDYVGTNHGVLTNGATFAAGQVGQTFALDGADDYMQVPDSASLRPVSVTIEAWVKFFATNGIRIILVKPLGTGTLDSYGLALQDGAVLAAICDNSGFGPFLYGPANTTPGQWYHLAYTFDDGSKQQVLYVNGTPVASGTANKTMSYDAQPVLLGADIEDGVLGFFHHGQIDEASLYNRALTSDEIATIYNAGAAGKHLPTPQLMLLPPEISGTNFKLTWTAVSNTTYRVEFNPNLSLSNWTALPGDVIGISNTASKLDALTSSNRLYRVRVIP